MFPGEPVPPAAQAGADRRRPVALRYSAPDGTFIVFVAGLSVDAATGNARQSSPFSLSPVSGTRELVGGREFAVRRDITATLPGSDKRTPGLTSVTFSFNELTWRGKGELLNALVTVIGTYPETELILIASSLR